MGWRASPASRALVLVVCCLLALQQHGGRVEGARRGLQGVEKQPEKDAAARCPDLLGYAMIDCIAQQLSVRTTQLSDVVPRLCEAMELKVKGHVEDCHLVALRLGEAAYKLGKKVAMKGTSTKPLIMRAVAAAVDSCDDSLCMHGCVHGVMVGAVADLNLQMKQGAEDSEADPTALRVDFMQQLVDICRQVTGTVSHYTCVHGAGHGLGREGVMASEDEAESFCEDSQEIDPQFAHGCGVGLMMEHVWGGLQDLSLNKDQIARDKDATILSDICARYRETPHQLASCASHVGEGLMFRTRHNLHKVLPYCEHMHPSAKMDCEDSARSEEQVVGRGPERFPQACVAEMNALEDWKREEARSMAAQEARQHWLDFVSGCLWPLGAGPKRRQYQVLGNSVEFYPPPGLEVVDLPFCGDVLPIPVRVGGGSDPLALDKQLSDHFNDMSGKLVNASTRCIAQTREQYCWTAFELCTAYPTETAEGGHGVWLSPWEKARQQAAEQQAATEGGGGEGEVAAAKPPPEPRLYEGCEHTHPRGEGAKQAVATCDRDGFTILCGPSPWGKTCHKIAGDVCAGAKARPSESDGKNPDYACGNSPEKFMEMATRCHTPVIRDGAPVHVIQAPPTGADLAGALDHIHANAPRTMEIWVRNTTKDLTGPVWEIPLPT